MWVEELRKIVNVAGLSLCFPPSYCENFKRQHPENNDKFPRTQKYSKIMNIQIVIRSRKNISDFFFSIGKEWSKNWQRNTVAQRTRIRKISQQFGNAKNEWYFTQISITSGLSHQNCILVIFKVMIFWYLILNI